MPSHPKPPNIEKFPAPKQRRLDALLAKNSEGTLLPREKATLAKLVEEAEQLMIANGKRLAEFSQGGSIPRAAVPVTVWVSPASGDVANHAKR